VNRLGLRGFRRLRVTAVLGDMTHAKRIPYVLQGYDAFQLTDVSAADYWQEV